MRKDWKRYLGINALRGIIFGGILGAVYFVLKAAMVPNSTIVDRGGKWYES
jgi:hypothetical protein